MNLLRWILAGSVLMLGACSAGSDEDSEETDDDFVAESGDDSDLGPKFTSDCGVVMGGLVSNPVSSSRGTLVTISSVLSTNALVISRPQGLQALKLHAVSPATSGESYATTTLNAFVGQQVTLFEASTALSKSCAATLPGGGQGIAGQLFTSNGNSISEELLKSGAQVGVEASGSCGEELIAGCYSALKDSAPPRTMGEIRDFLWKPAAESSYNPGGLAIHADPCNATVFVNGTALPDYGPGNGRCNTSRSSKPGCAFGNGVKVEIFDNDTGLPYTHNGEPFITVPRGCSRFEFKM